MQEHVKLEIAVQLIAEKIAKLYDELDAAKTYGETMRIKAKIEEAYVEKEEISQGNMSAINKIIAEKQGEGNQPQQ